MPNRLPGRSDVAKPAGDRIIFGAIILGAHAPTRTLPRRVSVQDSSAGVTGLAASVTTT